MQSTLIPLTSHQTPLDQILVLITEEVAKLVDYQYSNMIARSGLKQLLDAVNNGSQPLCTNPGSTVSDVNQAMATLTDFLVSTTDTTESLSHLHLDFPILTLSRSKFLNSYGFILKTLQDPSSNYPKMSLRTLEEVASLLN